MAISLSAASPHAAAFRDERTAHDPRARLCAANANEPDAGAAPLIASAQTSPYRAVGLYQGRGLAWPAWAAALALHGALALIAVALGWTSTPPSPLPDTITVVFEHAPAPAAAPAPQPVQPPVSTAREVPKTLPVEQPAHPVTVPAPASGPARVAALPMPMPPPVRPRSEPVAQAPSKPVAAPAPAVPAASAAPPRVAALPTSLAALPMSPPRPVSGMAGNRKPVYPLVARSRHLEGRVMLQVQVAASGDPLAVRVIASSGHDMLDVAAVDAVRTWRFVPASRAGQPVAGSVDVPIDFRMMD